MQGPERCHHDEDVQGSPDKRLCPSEEHDETDIAISNEDSESCEDLPDQARSYAAPSHVFPLSPGKDQGDRGEGRGSRADREDDARIEGGHHQASEDRTDQSTQALDRREGRVGRHQFLGRS